VVLLAYSTNNISKPPPLLHYQTRINVLGGLFLTPRVTTKLSCFALFLLSPVVEPQVHMCLKACFATRSRHHIHWLSRSRSHIICISRLLSTAKCYHTHTRGYPFNEQLGFEIHRFRHTIACVFLYRGMSCNIMMLRCRTTTEEANHVILPLFRSLSCGIFW